MSAADASQKEIHRQQPTHEETLRITVIRDTQSERPQWRVAVNTAPAEKQRTDHPKCWGCCGGAGGRGWRLWKQLSGFWKRWVHTDHSIPASRSQVFAPKTTRARAQAKVWRRWWQRLCLVRLGYTCSALLERRPRSPLAGALPGQIRDHVNIQVILIVTPLSRTGASGPTSSAYTKYVSVSIMLTLTDGLIP